MPKINDVKENDKYERKKICTLKKSSYAATKNFSAYKNIFGGLTYYYINIKGNDEYERKKIYKNKSKYV